MRVRYQHPLKFYETVFQTSVRAIKDWIAVGKRPESSALPPLDAPAEMLDWWGRHMKQRPPAKIMRLTAASSENAGAGSTDQGSVGSIDVQGLDITGLNSLRQARVYLAALDKKLSAAYLAGNENDVLRFQVPFERALEAVRRAEIAERNLAKSRGDFIPKSEVMEELAHFLTLLRMMQATMPARIIVRLENLCPPDIEALKFFKALTAAIEKERDAEQELLRRLKSFRSTEDIFQLESQVA